MILGPYRNPPYRNPSTPKSSLSPPPNGNNHNNRQSSPKRKLQEDDSPVSGLGQPLQIDTERIADQGDLAHPDSPRSHVANRLKDLAIRQAQPATAYEVPSSSQSPRKKLKRNPHIRDLRGDVQSRQLAETPRPPRPLEIPDSVSDNSTLLLEVQETPAADDAYARLPSTPLHGDGVNEAFDMIMSDLKEQEPPKSSPTRNKRMLSPPPPQSDDDPFIPSPDDGDLSSLTWQDSEITGHEINSPDDDGEGINGIGFRPTAAIAYARSQKRRQQVEGWKAREAREARQRRMDNRRRRPPSHSRNSSGNLDGASDGVLSDEGSGRRTVRFAT